MIKWLLSTIAAAVVVSGAACADERPFDTIQDLHTMCQDNAPLGYWGWCMGYLLGVADTMVESHGSKDERICVKDYTGAMLQRIFINWAEKHPKRWQESRWIGATTALHEAWPCK